MYEATSASNFFWFWPDSIEAQIGRLFATATSIFLANITFEGLDNLDDFEVLFVCLLYIKFNVMNFGNPLASWVTTNFSESSKSSSVSISITYT